MNKWINGSLMSTLAPLAIQAGTPVPGLALPGLHEFYAATEADAAGTTGVMVALALQASARPILWVRQAFLCDEGGTPYPPGLMEFGLDPSRIILLQPKDTQSVLQAGLEGARAAALGAVLVELWGEVKALDLTASRRLALAARAAGTRLLMARIAAKPCPSAAETRWEVRVAPSRALAANAPGNPAVSLRLLRHRGGQDQGLWQWEWNRDRACFETRGVPAVPARTAPLSGAVVPLSLDGQVPPRHAAERSRQAG